MSARVFLHRMLLSIFITVACTISHAQYKICKEPKVNIESQGRAESWAAARAPLAVTKLVRVYFHILRADGGYGEAATVDQINEEFADLVEDYAPYNICFANVGYDFIDNSVLNYDIDPDVDEDVALLNPFLIPNCINIFYHSSLGDYGGNAYNIPNTFCSIVEGNIGLWRTISHEVGHCLGLSHTFSTGGSGEEYISGSGCSTRGDRVCDTPADPYTEGSCFSANNCSYTGSCTDPSGASNYSPPYQNIMSYWGSEGCTVTHFTEGQYVRANSFLETDAGLLNTVSPATIAVGSLNINSGYFFRTARTSITVSGTINFTGPAITSLQSQSVTLPPGFTAAPQGGGSTLIRPTCIY